MFTVTVSIEIAQHTNEKKMSCHKVISSQFFFISYKDRDYGNFKPLQYTSKSLLKKEIDTGPNFYALFSGCQAVIFILLL